MMGRGVGEGRGCDGRGCGCDGMGCGGGGCAAWVIGAGTTGGSCSLPPTPHLTSPLEGGRDELGKGWVLGWQLGPAARRFLRLWR